MDSTPEACRLGFRRYQRQRVAARWCQRKFRLQRSGSWSHIGSIRRPFHATGQMVRRFPVAFQIAFAIPTLLLLPFLPESPGFNYDEGRDGEADIALAALKNDEIDSEAVQAERKQILDAIQLEDHLGQFNWKAVFWNTSGQHIHIRMLLVVTVQALQELPDLPWYSTTPASSSLRAEFRQQLLSNSEASHRSVSELDRYSESS